MEAKLNTLFLLENKLMSPQAVINSFLSNSVTKRLDGDLWYIFRLAINGGLAEGGAPISAEEVASLFDQLIALVGAVEALHQGGSGASLLLQEGGQGDV